MSFPRYPEVKDSGVEWIGKVPAHWVVGPLRWYATIQGGVAKGKRYSDDTPTVDLPYLRVANVQDGHVDLSSVNTVTVALSEVDRYRLQPGDVLMNEGGDNDKLGRGTVWQGEIADCLHQNHVFAIRPNQYLLPYWLSMFTRSGAARSYFYLYSKQSTNLASISSSNVMSCPLPLPPQEEQRQVLRFLDHEADRIDALVEEQQRLIELLKEKRQAFVAHAVTKGLDPDVPMKDSGVEWLGEVPAHWEVRKLSSTTDKITNGYVGPTRGLFVDDGIPYLQSLHIKNNVIKFSPEYYVTKEWSDAHAKSILSPGDVLVVQTGDIGQVAVVPEGFPEANCHALIIVSAIKKLMTGDWLAWVLDSDYGFNSLLSIKTGALHPHLNCGYVKDIYVPVPPLEEQYLIVKHVAEQQGVFLNLISEAESMIGYLKERRSALISAAVTGKIDVRGWQPPSGSPAASDTTQTEMV